jgi:F0F1-type ATP synthase assembly protein I
MGKAAAYMGLPFVLLASIAGGYYAGDWIDRTYGTRYANLIGIILGFALGLYEVMRQLKYLESRQPRD